MNMNLINYIRKRFTFDKELKLIKNYIMHIIIFTIVLLISIRINYYKKRGFKQELLLFWGPKSCFHIHHWITFGILAFVLILGKYVPMSIFYIILIVFFAIIVEDLLFKDVFNFKCKYIFT